MNEGDWIGLDSLQPLRIDAAEWMNKLNMCVFE